MESNSEVANYRWIKRKNKTLGVTRMQGTKRPAPVEFATTTKDTVIRFHKKPSVGVPEVRS